MFTGIITHKGTVLSREERGDTRFVIQASFAMADVAIGASIACSGACMTVVEKAADWFAVDVSGESLSRTTLAQWNKGRVINLERSLKLGDELGGHIVTGHVDGLAIVESIEPVGDSHKLTFRAPKELQYYIAAKGSVTLDGVSLTVNTVNDALFTVNIIPHTWQETTLGRLVVGDKVNLEIDVLARYSARWMEQKL